MYHDSCVPALFLRVKAKIAPPVLMAAARSEEEVERDRDSSSKAAEDGKASRRVLGQAGLRGLWGGCTVLQRHGDYVSAPVVVDFKLRACFFVAMHCYIGFDDEGDIWAVRFKESEVCEVLGSL
jgi:hypothetical protein